MPTSGTRKKEGIPPFPVITALRCPDLLLLLNVQIWPFSSMTILTIFSAANIAFPFERREIPMENQMTWGKIHKSFLSSWIESLLYSSIFWGGRG